MSFTEDEGIKALDYTRNGGEIIFSTDTGDNDPIDRFEIAYYNTELWLSFADGGDYEAEQPLSEKQADEIIEVLSAWKKWRHGK